MTEREAQPEPRITFEHILETADLPTPGPDYYAARRRIWLTPRVTPPPRTPSSARDKLEEILSPPNSVHSPEVWNNGLERVWKGLSSGGKLKTRLPLNIVIKIIHAGWLRDKTWPAGMQAPDSDDEQQNADVPTTDLPETPNIQERSTQIPLIAPSAVLESSPPRMSSHRRR